MIRPALYLVLLFLALTSCDVLNDTSDDYDCATVLCAGPYNLFLEITENEENIFDTEIYALDDLSITAQNSEAFSLASYKSEYDEITRLVIDNTAWKEGVNNFSLVIADDYTIAFEVQIESNSEGCCSGIPYANEVRINNVVQENVYDIPAIELE